MIEKIDTSQIQSYMEKSSSRQPNSTVGFGDNDADVSVQVDYASFIDKAIKTQQVDDKTVHRARELLLSGELEKRVNVLQAAENIIDFGI
jgi:hypothetical protein